MNIGFTEGWAGWSLRAIDEMEANNVRKRLRVVESGEGCFRHQCQKYPKTAPFFSKSY